MKFSFLIVMLVFFAGCSSFKIFDPKTKGGESGTVHEIGKINQQGQQSEAPEEAMTQTSKLTQKKVLPLTAGSTVTEGEIKHLDGSIESYTKYEITGPSETYTETIQEANTEVGASMNFEKLAIKAIEHKQAAGTIFFGVLMIAAGCVVWWKTGLVVPSAIAILSGFLAIVIAKIGLYFVIGGIGLAVGGYLLYKTGLYKQFQHEGEPHNA